MVRTSRRISKERADRDGRDGASTGRGAGFGVQGSDGVRGVRRRSRAKSTVGTREEGETTKTAKRQKGEATKG